MPTTSSRAGSTVPTIVVTGVSGFAGRRIARMLSEQGVRIIGIDRRPLALSLPGMTFHQGDLRTLPLPSLFAGADAVVHLAFVVNPMHSPRTERATSLGALRATLDAITTARVPRLIYTSAAGVYGAHPDNPIPMTEEQPLRPNLDYLYSVLKVEAERIVQQWGAANRQVGITIFRPSIYWGASIENAISRAFEMPVLLKAAEYEPPLQFVHEDDVASAVQLALERRVTGVFNLTTPGHLTLSQIMREVEGTVIEVPAARLRRVVGLLWHLRMAFVPSGYLSFVMHPWVVSADKLAAEGFQSRHDQLGTFREGLAARRTHVMVGEFRLRRRSLAGLTGTGLLRPFLSSLGTRHA
jgi:UDP-glucose 4-epimerase